MGRCVGKWSRLVHSLCNLFINPVKFFPQGLILQHVASILLDYIDFKGIPIMYSQLWLYFPQTNC